MIAKVLKCRRDILLLALCILYLKVSSCAQSQQKIHAVGIPTVQGKNDFYVGNRPPLLPNPLIKLPVGSIKPDGWLKHQLESMAEGFTGHLEKISKWCNIDGSAWVNHEGVGRYGWEEMPYWLRGFIDLGYILNDKRIIDESNRWMEGILLSQDSTGYFGPRDNRDNHDIWPNMITLYALRTYYEATNDKRVIPLMTRYAGWLMSVPLQDYLPGSWQKWRGGDNLDHIYWLYNQTGEQTLLDLARLNHERTSDWTGGIPTWHGVNLCQGFREPAEYYQQTNDIRYLRATERNYDSIMNTYGQVPGGMFGADEDARKGYTGPRQATETCSIVEVMHSDEMLASITGNPVWADRCEEVAFNSLPAAMTPDLRGLHYLTAPNLVQLDSSNKAPLIENDGDMFAYNPWDYRCCQHNVAFGWPYFAENLWMATRDNGLVAVLYAANSVTAKVGNGTQIQIKETTDYPFSEAVELKLATPADVGFPLILRVPGWCNDMRISINDKRIDAKAAPDSWVSINRTWKNGDAVKLELPMNISVKVWKKNHNAVSVQRGPLAYSLKIGERWQRFAGTEQWPAFEVFPTTSWNYGLIVNLENPSTSFEVIQHQTQLSTQPFSPDYTPIELKGKGRHIPQWKLESNGLVGDLRESPVKSDDPVETITLIPMGCARLRITAFPWIEDGPDAKVWK